MLFEDVELLIALSEAKSLSQAADKLFMSRQGLAQRISNLELRIGKSLYNRTSTGISMTEAGEMVTSFARNIANEERILKSQLAAIDEEFAPTMEIGMSINDGVVLLPALVAGWMANNPETRVHLEAGYEPLLIDKLRSGDLDFAMVENQAQEPDIVLETLGYTKLVFIGPNKAPYNEVIHPLPIETLLEWPMILYEWNSGRHMVGNRHFRERYGVSLADHNMVARFDTHEAMAEGVKAGIGWATIPECVYARYKNDPDIVRFRVNTGPLWYPVQLAWSSERLMKEDAGNFIEFIKKNVPKDYFFSDVELINPSNGF